MHASATPLIDGLRDARAVELAMFRDLSEDQILGWQEHFLEPPIWEIGHVGWFQEWWILRHLDRAAPILPRGDGIYDAFRVSYKIRWQHDFPSRDETLRYLDTVLERCVKRLENRAPRKNDVYFYTLAALHEQMHSENLAYVRRTLGYPEPWLPIPRSAPPAPDPEFEPGDVEIPGGVHRLGAERSWPFVFDNEQWAHEVEVAPFRISKTPVTNREYAAFVEAGGYGERKWWSREGWEWRRRAEAEHPLFWTPEKKGWQEKRYDETVPLEPHHPVCWVNGHEAEAYCAWANRRLPTEAEWERAATGPTKRTYPWGDDAPTPERANLDYRHGGPVDVSAFPEGDSPYGCRQMIGNVWEWTSSLLGPYPGFSPMAYKEYSQPYFGEKPVLRGGGWATRSSLIRGTWRNFYMKHRRNIAAGFRTVAL